MKFCARLLSLCALKKILQPVSQTTRRRSLVHTVKMPSVSKADVERIVTNHRVVLFSKSTCPFCSKVKDLFKSKHIRYYNIELDKVGWRIWFNDYLLLSKMIRKLMAQYTRISWRKLRDSRLCRVCGSMENMLEEVTPRSPLTRRTNSYPWTRNRRIICIVIIIFNINNGVMGRDLAQS